MRARERFRITTRSTLGGGFTWQLRRYDAAVAAMLGETQGWTHVKSGNASSRPLAEAMARSAIEHYIWVLEHDDTEEEYFEL